jgi:pimeloyl-ACP methyl ester carboxylesterase
MTRQRRARAASVLPQARVERIDRCGHYPAWEQPDRFCDLLEAFLTSPAS